MADSTRDIGLADRSESESCQSLEFERSLAVVIGIDGYAAPIPPLKTPVNDARAVAMLLEQQHKYTILELLTEGGTRDRLITLFSKTLFDHHLTTADRVIVYFAGHGTVAPGDDGEPEYYLIPEDANLDRRPSSAPLEGPKRYGRESFISMRWVRDELLKLACRHLLIVLDCCFAGGFGRMRSFGTPPDKVYCQRYQFFVRSPAWQVLASAAYDETALDTAGGYVFGRRFAGRQPDNSPFAREFLAALSGVADVNPPAHAGMPVGDGLITATELLSWIAPRLQGQASDSNHRQSPGLWRLPNHQGGEYVFRNPNRALTLEQAPPLTDGTNPYRGLNSYEESDAAHFFGRKKQIETLVELVKARSFVAVLGTSGTGKSSLVKAGLIPALGRSHQTGEPASPRPVGDAAWLVLPPLRPGAKPVASLEKTLTEHLPGYVALVAPLVSNAQGLAAVVRGWAADHPGGRLVLVIDQFEELVTLCGDPGQREHFQTLLRNGLAADGGALQVVVTVRTDFEPQFTKAGAPLAEIWPAGRYTVPPMSQENFRDVILRPAWKEELYFDPYALVEELIDEVIQAPGGLPLLSFALSEMYLRYVESGRQDRTLRREDYTAVGGVIGSVRESANRIWEEVGTLSSAHQNTMQRLMLRMVALEGGELARRRVSCDELDYGAEENARRDDVITRLKKARLVVWNDDDQWVEPAHDALVSGWDRLMEWKLQAASDLPLQRELAPVALRWQAEGADPSSGLLWDDDPRLPQLEETLWPTHGQQRGSRKRLRRAWQVLAPQKAAPVDTKWLNASELNFTIASVTRHTVVLRRVIGSVGLFVFMIVAAAVVAWVLRNQAVKAQAQAELAAREAKSGELAAESRVAFSEAALPEGLLLATEAYSISQATPSFFGQPALQTLYDGLEQTGGRPRSLGDEAIFQTVISPNGKWLATNNSDNQVRLWEVRQLWEKPHSEPRVLGTHAEGQLILSVAFSPDSAWLATGGSDGTIALWPVEASSSTPQIDGAMISLPAREDQPVATRYIAIGLRGRR